MGRNSKNRNKALTASTTSAEKRAKEGISNILVVKILDARAFVFATLVEGLTYAQAYEFSLLINCIPPSESVFYAIQPEIINILVQKAQESCNKAAALIPDSATISFDSAWDYNRRGHFNILTFIEQTTNKIIDYLVLHHGTTYTGSVQGMENAALDVLVNRWKTNEKNQVFRA